VYCVALPPVRSGPHWPQIPCHHRLRSLFAPPSPRHPGTATRRLNWQKLFSGAVSLVCWRLRRWFPAARLTYGAQVGWNSGSIRHLSPPRGHSYNSPGIESAPGCGPGSASAAPAGPPERAAASLAPGPRPPPLGSGAGAPGAAHRGEANTHKIVQIQVLHQAFRGVTEGLLDHRLAL
jgi:hypothetical protein